ncbi:MAG: SPOR domain-containing protein [Bacteroidota bacterium]
MKPLLLFLAAFTVLTFAPGAVAQTSSPDIHAYIAQVNEGKPDEAQRDLPSLLAKYPDDPGVLYLEALLTTDGANAARIYQSIVDNDPKSEWADAALYKVYQFYYALGLYKTADLKMAQLRKDYPNSKYLKAHTGTAVASRPPQIRDTVAAATVTPAEHVTPVVPPSKPAPAPGPALSPKHDPVRTGAAEAYTLQVGAFSSEANAEKLQRTVQGLGYRVEIVPRVRLDRTMYLVWLGSFATEAEARAGAAELRDKHAIDAMVVSR